MILMVVSIFTLHSDGDSCYLFVNRKEYTQL